MLDIDDNSVVGPSAVLYSFDSIDMGKFGASWLKKGGLPSQTNF